MNWKRYDDSGTRWTWTADDERHLLFFDTAAGELREYHEVPGGPVAVHVYGTLANADELDSAAPLADASHMESMDVAPEDADHLRQLNNSKVFEYLEIGKSW